MSVAVIIAAGGRGLRMGVSVPKQLIAVAGKSLLTRSIEAFSSRSDVSEIVVVVPAEHVADASAYVPATAAAQVRIVAGGDRRQDSVAQGLAALSDRADLVLVHDAARAFVTADVITRTIDATREYGAAVA